MGLGRTDYKAWNVAPGTVRVSCVFWPKGTSAPTVESRLGVLSVTRTGVGTFDITLVDKWVGLEGWSLGVNKLKNTYSETQAQLTAAAVSSTGVVSVTLVDGSGTPTDPDARDVARISAVFFLKATTAV